VILSVESCNKDVMDFTNHILDRIIAKLSRYSSFWIVIITTVFVLLGSIPMVYLFSKILGVTYTYFLFSLSVLLPLILTPVVITLLIRLTKHLKYYKEHLKQEIDKNKEKDIIIFEQARFALMGEMIANISHQWKQPLNTIGLAVVSAKVSGLEKETVKRSFDIMEDTINYLANTINDFMSFFNQKTYSEVKKLQSIVQEIKSISSVEILSKNIKLDIQIEALPDTIELGSSISQVLLNLINNAKDSFTKEIENPEIIIKFIPREYFLEISCCDNANGIDPAIIDKIFTPYFTTKEKSQGTGIGLYMSRQIIEKVFHAEIKVSSKTGETCFNISIPYSDKCIRG